MSLNSRFYERAYPLVGEVVIVKVTSLVATGAFVSLLEYNMLEGHCAMRELSQWKLEKLQRRKVPIIKVGGLEVMEVVGVDATKGHIDLNKKKLKTSDVLKATDRWNKSKDLHSAFRSVCRSLQKLWELSAGEESIRNKSALEIEDTLLSVRKLYEKIGWRLYKELEPHHPIDYLQEICNNKPQWTEFCARFGPELSEPLRLLRRDIQKRQQKKRVVCLTHFYCNCYLKHGIDSIKAALLVGLECSTEEYPILIKVGNDSTFCMKTQFLAGGANAAKAQIAMGKLNEALAAIKKAIEQRGGRLTEIRKPYIVDGRRRQPSKHLKPPPIREKLPLMRATEEQQGNQVIA